LKIKIVNGVEDGGGRRHRLFVGLSQEAGRKRFPHVRPRSLPQGGKGDLRDMQDREGADRAAVRL
jgi:hypothetical protein